MDAPLQRGAFNCGKSDKDYPASLSFDRHTQAKVKGLIQAVILWPDPAGKSITGMPQHILFSATRT